MPFYLSEYIGAGTYKDPCRPVGSDQPGWSAIDLRADGGATLDGGGLNACLLHVPTAFTDPKARFLADDKLESLTNPQKNFLQNRLGVDLSSPTLLRDIVATLMTNPPANGWKSIRPTPLRWEIWLGGLLWTAPVIQGGADAVDDFNRADATLSSPWVPRGTGTMQYSIVSNRVRKSVDGDFVAAYSGSVSADDQWAQFDAPVVGTYDLGPTVRLTHNGSNQLTGYVFALFDNIMGKWVAGTFSQIGSALSFYSAKAAGDRWGLNVIGSNLYGFQNGRMLHEPASDTSISVVGDGASIFIYPSYGTSTHEVDNFRGGNTVRSNPTTAPSVFTRAPTMTLFSSFESSAASWDAISTPAAPIPAGRLVVIGGIIGDANPTISSITDLAGNVYTIIRQDVHNPGTASRAFLAYSLLTNDLGPADSIIITQSLGINRRAVVIASSYEVPAGTFSLTGSGFAQDTTFPQSSNPAPSSVTALANNALCVSFVLAQPTSANPTFTPSSGLTQIVNIEESSTTYHGYAEDGLVNAGSVSPTPVPSVSMYWTAYQAVFEVVAAPTSLPVDADFTKFPKTIMRRA